MKVLGAGGVLFDLEGNVLLIRDRQGYWCFPKGHIDRGEDLGQTALREVEEETGIKGKLVRELSPTHYTNNQGVSREIRWFLMKGMGKIKMENGLNGAGFFEPQEAKRLLAFKEDVQLLEQAVRQINLAHFSQPSN